MTASPSRAEIDAIRERADASRSWHFRTPADEDRLMLLSALDVAEAKIARVEALADGYVTSPDGSHLPIYPSDLRAALADEEAQING